ncbi:MAG TPA: hypothetical protein VFZ53_23140 [Polyangiaceae bacterium]
MKTAIVESRCECQAKLSAELDEERRALRGWARDSRGRERLAPATAMHAGNGRFDVGFFCPFCTRNTLRSFESEALAYSESRATG